MLEIVSETLSSGTVVAGAYRLERIVGEGGMGVVWEATELVGGRRVALKFLQEKRQADRRNQERVLREARATMAISHPNIAEIFAVLETDAGVPFLVMELLQGETLRAYLTRHGALDPVQCARILRPVISAVEAAHHQRIVHRDLKPENIFLLASTELQVRVLDFGIAKQLPHMAATTVPDHATSKPSLTSTGAVLGTPVYMAPEQIFGDSDVDDRADVWSVGIILYECLAGRRPTDAEGFGQIIKRITSDPIVPIEQVRPGLPPILNSTVAAMLRRDRSTRPKLADVQTVLERVESPSTTDDAQLQRRIEPNYRAIKRPRWLIGAAFLASMVILGVTSMMIWQSRSVPVTTSQGSPSSGTSAVVADAPDAMANAYYGLTLMMTNAQKAMMTRDGRTCMRELDRYDASPSRGAFKPSGDPAGPEGLRGICLMLDGQCEAGKIAYRDSIVNSPSASAAMTPDLVDITVESANAQYCEAAHLSERDELLRADARLNAFGLGQRSGTSAACKDAYATEQRLIPLVQPKNEKDVNIVAVQTGLEMRASRCFAKVGDCAKAFPVYRADYLKNPAPGVPQSDREKEVRTYYDLAITGTPCVGKY